MMSNSFEPSPMPNQTRPARDSEIDGTKRTNWMYGSSARRTSRDGAHQQPERRRRWRSRSGSPRQIRPGWRRMSVEQPAREDLVDERLADHSGVGNSTGGKNAARRRSARGAIRAHTTASEIQRGRDGGAPLASAARRPHCAAGCAHPQRAARRASSRPIAVDPVVERAEGRIARRRGRGRSTDDLFIDARRDPRA